MAKLDLYEQEQISRIKYFFKDYGKYIFSIVLIIIVSYITSVLYKSQNQQKSIEASNLYSEVLKNINSNNLAVAINLVDKLNSAYKIEEYTAFANLSISKEFFTKKDYANAIKYLDYLVANSKDISMIAIAKLRLADIYIDQNKLDEALAIVTNKSNKDFDVLYYQKQGDIFLLKKDIVKAKDAYNAALQSAGGNQEIASIIKMKMDFAS
jgi:predicted negative regulator of RcsB-dependent stress response